MALKKVEILIYSDTEFYYAEPSLVTTSYIKLNQEETKHLTQVMRHSVGDNIFVTDGNGNIYKTAIKEISKKYSTLSILSSEKINERFPNITLFIPILKSSDRLEFALEKSIELGITNFAIYSAEKSHKRGVKLDRWNKIALSSMKQSLQAYKAKIKYIEKLKSSNSKECINIIFDQLANEKLTDYLDKIHCGNNINLIFGPEAGLTKKDIEQIDNPQLLCLTKNRLRAETAIISATSIIVVA